MHVLYAAKDWMRQLRGVKDQPRALFVIRAVVRNPRLAEDLPAEAAGIFVLVLPIEFAELRIRPFDLKGVRRGAKADHWPAAVEIIDDVLHLVVRKILEPEEHDQEISALQRFEAADV